MANITEMASWLQGKTETKGYRWIPQYLETDLYGIIGNSEEVKNTATSSSYVERLKFALVTENSTVDEDGEVVKVILVPGVCYDEEYKELYVALGVYNFYPKRQSDENLDFDTTINGDDFEEAYANFVEHFQGVEGIYSDIKVENPQKHSEIMSLVPEVFFKPSEYAETDLTQNVHLNYYWQMSASLDDDYEGAPRPQIRALFLCMDGSRIEVQMIMDGKLKGFINKTRGAHKEQLASFDKTPLALIDKYLIENHLSGIFNYYLTSETTQQNFDRQNKDNKLMTWLDMRYTTEELVNNPGTEYADEMDFRQRIMLGYLSDDYLSRYEEAITVGSSPRYLLIKDFELVSMLDDASWMEPTFKNCEIAIKWNNKYEYLELVLMFEHKGKVKHKVFAGYTYLGVIMQFSQFLIDNYLSFNSFMFTDKGNNDFYDAHVKFPFFMHPSMQPNFLKEATLKDIKELETGFERFFTSDYLQIPWGIKEAGGRKMLQCSEIPKSRTSVKLLAMMSDPSFYDDKPDYCKTLLTFDDSSKLHLSLNVEVTSNGDYLVELEEKQFKFSNLMDLNGFVTGLLNYHYGFATNSNAIYPLFSELKLSDEDDQYLPEMLDFELTGKLPVDFTIEDRVFESKGLEDRFIVRVESVAVTEPINEFAVSVFKEDLDEGDKLNYNATSLDKESFSTNLDLSIAFSDFNDFVATVVTNLNSNTEYPDLNVKLGSIKGDIDIFLETVKILTSGKPLNELVAIRSYKGSGLDDDVADRYLDVHIMVKDQVIFYRVTYDEKSNMFSAQVSSPPESVNPALCLANYDCVTLEGLLQNCYIDAYATLQQREV